MTLLSIQWQGAALAACLFLGCLVAVHAVKLTIVGYRALRKRPPERPDPPQKPERTERPAEPVYFIVERKKKRSKPEYSEPKCIQFK